MPPEYLSPEEFEQARRKTLADLQQAAADERISPTIWKMVFRERDEYDRESSGYLWIPREPYENLTQLMQRVEKGCGTYAADLVCEHCISERLGHPGLLAGDLLEWGGFGPAGVHRWYHRVTVELPPSLLERIAIKRGYKKKPKTEERLVWCPASEIYHQFHLKNPPEVGGVNRGAYPSAPAPYGDPDAQP